MTWNWHDSHKEELAMGQRIADAVTAVMGSWLFIIAQSVILGAWVIFNVTSLYLGHWDPYPFILLNLVLSFQAAYAAPFIMISQNRQAERDRHQADADYATNIKAKEEIEELQRHLARLELEKLNKILEILNERPKRRN